MRVLVTGALGFVGKHLIEHLLAHSDQVVATDLAEKAESKGVEYHQLDVTNLDDCKELLAQIRPEVLYHLAGIAFAPLAEDDFTLALDANVLGTYNLLRGLSFCKLPCRFLLTSSAEVYQRCEPQDLPLTEQSSISPLHNYGLSKLMAEQVVQRFESNASLATVIVRPFNHIGPGQRDDFVVSNFARQLARIASGKSEALIRVGNLQARRDFSDVRDIVRAYRLIATKGKGLYNLCSGQAHSISEILQRLIKVSGLEVEIREEAARLRPLEVPLVYGSYARAESDLGWQPTYSLNQTLEDIYQYWLKVESGRSC